MRQRMSGFGHQDHRQDRRMKKKRWNDYLWIVSALYIALGFVNILFAWIGILCFFIPLIISAGWGSKVYCHKYCVRGELLEILGNKCRLSAKRDILPFIRTKAFRYGFLTFFMIMFIDMIFATWLIFKEASSAKEVVTLLWAIKLPWRWAAGNPTVSPWISQFAFGFYSVMLTSTVLGIITMIFFKPRSWCVYCPMGTMTQLICRLRNRKEIKKQNTLYNQDNFK